MNESGRRKILVVDDQPTLAKAIRRMLGDHDVTTVVSAREALDKIGAGERYDVILTDVMMPEISGMELHTRLAALAPEQVEKMVFMTGGAFTKQAAEFFDHVANPTIEKPFDRAALFAVIDGLLTN
ncbi:MAG TPA: response regulator [Kofleriaceae bacterium]